MSSNPGNPNNPARPQQPAPPKMNVDKKAGHKDNESLDPQAEALRKLIEQMADDNPASIAEIIHLWLNEDKK